MPRGALRSQRTASRGRGRGRGRGCKMIGGSQGGQSARLEAIFKSQLLMFSDVRCDEEMPVG